MLPRFQDQNFSITHFRNEVVVVCPQCQKKALSTVNYEAKTAKLTCMHCGYHKAKSTVLSFLGLVAHYKESAHRYFGATLWYQAPFKKDCFFAYNEAHLHYLEQYIGAKLREHKDRTHFTLLEKLPKFYHEAKNRDALLKLINKLKNKV
jgi:Zn ribbon nucleic-acid-binding protein